MGIDVNLYAEGHVSDERLAEATAYMLDRCYIVDTFDGKFPALERDNSYDHPRIRVSTMSRYYGAGYERGDWPSIYGAIRLLQTALPGCVVHYGGDTDDDAPEVTEESLAETWAHFLGPNGDDYRQEVRRWNAAARS